MKKIIISEETQEAIHLSAIDDYDLVIGIVADDSSDFDGEIHIVAEYEMDCYKLISIQDYMTWKSSSIGHESIQGLIKAHQADFTFYLLNDWKEIKVFL